MQQNMKTQKYFWFWTGTDSSFHFKNNYLDAQFHSLITKVITALKSESDNKIVIFCLNAKIKFLLLKAI